MATFNGEPYPGFFKDLCNDTSFLTEPVAISNQWLPSHEDECDFAKFNSEVLTVIHEEKRFPTKEELQTIFLESIPTPTENVWGNIKFGDHSDSFAFDNCFWFRGQDENGTSPAAGNTTYTTYGEPLQWDGASWQEFIQEDLPSEYQASALTSTKGVTDKNLNHRLL